MSGYHNNWYCNRRWRRRRRAQLMAEPLCQECKKRGLVEVALVADHIVSHRGNWTAFMTGPLQSLCKGCHDAKSERERGVLAGRWEKGCDERGWPLDPNHPAYIERS